MIQLNFKYVVLNMFFLTHISDVTKQAITDGELHAVGSTELLI